MQRSSVCALILGMFAILGMVAACTVHQSNQAPPLTGPSTFAQSLSVTATPDRITQDGLSQSAIAVRVFDVNGQPVSAVPIRVDILVNGTLVDYGTLSTKSIVTGTDGRATTVYTAPPAPPPTAQISSTVTIRATVLGSDAQSSVPYSADIRLVPPGVILPPAGTPTAAFSTSPASLVAGVPVNFDASASVPGSGATAITSYAWVFGDGTTGSGRTTTHSYATANTYNVTLTVTNDRGIAASTAPQSLTVSAAVPPTANFNFSPLAPGVGESVFFNAASSAPGIGHTIASYRWSFGDGASASGQGTSHQYATAGTYTVTLTVFDEADQSATTAQTVTIGAPPGPTARFTKSPTQPTVNEIVVFSAATSSTSQGQTITDYFWNFGDDASCPQVSGTNPPACYVQTSSPNITHQYARNGTFTINLVVRDSAGRTGSTQDTVPVGAGNPTASITFSPSSGITTATVVTFDGTGSTAFGGATIVSYIWNFDDPLAPADVATTEPRTTFRFSVARSHLVRLTVVDSQNRRGTITTTVNVTP